MELKPITRSSTILRNEKNLMTNTLGNELVMMNTETGNYIGLNDIGTAIWEMIASPVSVATLIDNLLKRYEIDEERCERETLIYLKKLQEAGMLDVVDK